MRLPRKFGNLFSDLMIYKCLHTVIFFEKHEKNVAHENNNWVKVFTRGANKICGRQPLESRPKETMSLQIF